jgi:hypothetical protein
VEPSRTGRIKTLIPSETIERKIFLIRAQKVMLSTPLAELYGIETRVLMQAVRRNGDRFPDDFKFTLTRDEVMRISQIVTSLKYSKAVYAFTEQGVAMPACRTGRLSSVLNSPRAIQVNIAIMRAFMKLRDAVRMKKSRTSDGRSMRAFVEELLT